MKSNKKHLEEVEKQTLEIIDNLLPKYISPAVYTKEIDLSDYVPDFIDASTLYEMKI